MTEYYVDPADEARVLARLREERAARREAAFARKPLIERIADAMLEISGAGQTVDRHQLSLRGFTLAELSDERLSAARDLANRRATRPGRRTA